MPLCPRQRLALLVGAGFADETGFRIGQLAWPLVALQVSDSPWAVGLVSGAFGVPVVLAPWWTRTLRQRVDSSGRVAAFNLVEGVVLLAVPLMYLSGVLGVAALVAVGLVRGFLTAVSVPARSAILADLGDRAPGLSAARTLSWDEGQTRAAYVVGPATAGALWALAPVVALLATSVTCLVAAALSVSARVRGEPADPDDTPSIREAVRGHRLVLASWVMRGTTSLGWFALGLGIPVLTNTQGGGAGVAAAALALYGVGGSAVVLLVARHLDSLPLMRTQCLAWTVCGASIVGAGLVGTGPALLACAVLAGAATQLANTCCNAQVARSLDGADRRAALSGQRTMITVLSTAGLMGSGSLFGTIGVVPAIVIAGTTITAVTWLVALWHVVDRRREPHGEPVV